MLCTIDAKGSVELRCWWQSEALLDCKKKKRTNSNGPRITQVLIEIIANRLSKRNCYTTKIQSNDQPQGQSHVWNGEKSAIQTSDVVG
jgi:hypothetical protein|mmetsp:Transcript_8914/g.14739  ORF Transcript_8914/g.14739 Transcript_8914/m.14739 type:complete len:88 (-) Transcript_8914:398-661(-)